MNRNTDIKKFARITGTLAAGSAICAGLLVGGGGAQAGVPAGVGGAPVGQVGQGAAQSGSKLYGHLDSLVRHTDADNRLRVIVHMKDQVDLSTLPRSDKAGILNALRSKAATSQVGVRQSLAQDSSRANIYYSYWIFNGFALEATPDVLLDLAGREDVDYIIEDGYMTKPKIERNYDRPDNPVANWNIYQVRAPETWALGYDGRGRVVANIDSGVDGNHQALAARWRGVNGGTPANSWFDPFGLSPSFPTDLDGHGSHTMGTITGYQGDPTGTNEIGQAKSATWIAARNYDDTGKGPFSGMHAGFQFMADPDNNPNTNDQPDSVGNSWGEINAFTYPDLEWFQDIEAWIAVGIIPVFSNGNNGPGVATVGKPGSYPNVVGVGAITINRTIAGFSSRGPAPNLPPWNDRQYWERSTWNLLKPEVVAPGVNVRSSFPPSGSCPAPCYGSISGTSMASPHVTGLAGILRQVRPDLTFNEFYNIIIDTSYFTPTWGTRPNNNFGYGEIDDYAAAIYVRDAGAIMGAIMDGSCLTPVSGADVRVFTNIREESNVGIRNQLSDNNGNYRTILAAGNYTVTVSAPGFYGTAFTTQVMSTTTNTLPIMLTKMATGSVGGAITDGANPVVGATVSVVGLPNIRATSGVGGQYTLSNVPAGTYTLRAEKCGFTSARANVTVTYPSSQSINMTLAPATALLTDDFEDGNLDGWTVTGGSATTGIWHNSDLRGFNSNRAARVGVPGQPYYTGTASIDTQLTANTIYDTLGADKLYLSFDLYAKSESEYDVVKAQISTDGGATWPNSGAVFGQSGPRPDWESICLDVTQFKNAQMKMRFTFTTYAPQGNWNNEVFEGDSIDNVRLSQSGTGTGAPTATPVAALTPTPGTPVPCTPIPSATMTPVPPTVTNTAVPPTATMTAVPASATSTSAPTTPTRAATSTAVPCTVTFSDVPTTNTFYIFVRCLACRGVLGGYNDGTFRPNNDITRGQIAKVVSESAGYSEPAGSQMFQDVPTNNTFYAWINRLAIRGHMSGYPCGGAGEPCVTGNLPYFRPAANATRGQLSKIVSNARGINDPAGARVFADVGESDTFYVWIQRLANRNIMGGYACGGTGEPCDGQNRPFFRPFNNVTRGQAAKIVANAFFPDCGVAARR